MCSPLLRALPVRALWGVGPHTQTRLASLGLTTVAEIADTDREVLARALGTAVGHKLHDLAWGRDDRAVQARPAEASIGAESTFDVDIRDEGAVLRELLDLSEKAARRCRAAGMSGRTVSLKVRFADFSTVTRSQTLATPTNHGREVYAAAVRQWQRLGVGRRAVRLVGVRIESLTVEQQVSTQLEFGQEQETADWRAAEDAVDRIAARFPGAAPRPATLLESRPSPPNIPVREARRGVRVGRPGKSGSDGLREILRTGRRVPAGLVLWMADRRVSDSRHGWRWLNRGQEEPCRSPSTSSECSMPSRRPSTRTTRSSRQA